MTTVHRDTQQFLVRLQSNEHFKRIAAQDGQAGDLSTLDLAKANPEDIEGLLKDFKKNGYDLDEQGVVRLIQQLADVSLADASKYKSYDFASGSVNEVDFSTEQKVDEWELSQVQRTVAQSDDRVQHLYQPPVTLSPFDDESPQNSIKDYSDDGVPGNIKSDFSESAPDALAARERLRTDYGFHLRAGASLAEVARIKDTIPTEKIPAFMEDFMTAFYAHAGGVTWDSKVFDQSGAESLLFGNPPPLEQIPDGRSLIDCEAYASIAGVLLNKLVASADQPGNQNYSLQFMIPKHQLAVMRMGEDVYIIDNNHVRPIKMSEEEKTLLQSKYDQQFSSWTGGALGYSKKPLSGELDRQAFPSIDSYVDGHHYMTALTSRNYRFTGWGDL